MPELKKTKALVARRAADLMTSVVDDRLVAMVRTVANRIREANGMPLVAADFATRPSCPDFDAPSIAG